MNRNCAENELFAISQAALFFVTFLSGVNRMRNWVERLVQCGIPERNAQRIVDFFFKHRRTVELIAYVRMTEEAMGRQ